MSNRASGRGGADDRPLPAGVPDVPRRAWVVLSVVCVSVFLVVIDASVVNIAFPTIGEDLGTSDAVLSWILTSYNVTVASLLLLAGRTADRLGRKRVFLVSVAVFTLGSLLCSVAPGAGALIAFRVVQAAGGSAIFPASLALLLPEFPVERRSTAVGSLGGGRRARRCGRAVRGGTADRAVRLARDLLGERPHRRCHHPAGAPHAGGVALGHRQAGDST